MERHTKIFKIFCIIALGVIGGGAIIGAIGSKVEALEYKGYQRLDFTFAPVVQVTLSSSSLTIPDLMPDSSGDSNVIDITVGTNVPSGLQLTATVGRDDSAEHDEPGYADPYNTTSLVNGNSSFAALSAAAANLASSDFGTNKWGYSYCTAAASVCNSEDAAVIAANWVSGDAGNTSPGYNGLPLHSATGVKLAETNNTTNSALKFKIGAKTSSVQASGTYTNLINFVAITNVITTSYTVSFNNGDGASDWPTDISNGETNTDLNIPLGVTSGQNIVAPSKTGYTFMGWCTVSTNNDSCGGNVYQADETYPIANLGGTATVDLYAMWK